MSDLRTARAVGSGWRTDIMHEYSALIMPLSILAIETSTPICSVALWHDGALHEREETEHNQHSAKLAQMTSELLKHAQLQPNDLDAVAIGVGPGSFTGVRIAASFGQAIAFALDLPMVAVASTELVAQAAGRHGYDRVWVALDARLGELYTACYSRCSPEEAWQEQQQPTLMKPEAFSELLSQQSQGCGSERTCAAGDGFAAHAQVCTAAGLAVFTSIRPRAGSLATIAAREWQTRGIDATAVAAMYVRNDVAQTIEQRQAQRVKEAIA